jgi:hypothetical protein
LASTDHFWVLKSKIIKPCELAGTATTYRPSGDQRALNRPSEAGSVEISFAFRSKIRMAVTDACMAERPAKATELPSGDQAGSAWLPLWLGINGCGSPPAAATL